MLKKVIFGLSLLSVIENSQIHSLYSLCITETVFSKHGVLHLLMIDAITSQFHLRLGRLKKFTLIYDYNLHIERIKDLLFRKSFN